MSRLFISYRRQDSQGFAGRLCDDLSELFGPERVFRDVEIQPGSDFSQAIQLAIEGSEALLVVIGRHWLEARDASGAQRIFQQDDWVRVEIEAGLQSGKLILPVLVGGAEMPRENQLPPSIAPLSRRQAFVVTDRRWEQELQDLREFLLGQLPELRAGMGGERNRRPAGDAWQHAARETFRTLGERIATELKRSRTSSSTPRQLPWLLRVIFRGLKKAAAFGVLLVVIYFTVKNYGDASAQGVLRDLETFFTRLLKKAVSFFS